MSLQNAVGGGVIGRLTETADTVINALVPANRLGRAFIAALLYLCGSTAHTLTFLRALGRTKFTTATAAAGTVIYMVRNPGPDGTGNTGTVTNNGYPQGVTANLLAANDLVVIRETDGVSRVYTVSSVSTTNPLAVTLTGGLTAGVDVNSDMWMLGITTDTDPTVGRAHPTRLAVVSVNNMYPGAVGAAACGVCASHRNDEPILVQSNNATAAGAFNSVDYAYVPEYK